MGSTVRRLGRDVVIFVQDLSLGPVGETGSTSRGS